MYQGNDAATENAVSTQQIEQACAILSGRGGNGGQHLGANWNVTEAERIISIFRLSPNAIELALHLLRKLNFYVVFCHDCLHHIHIDSDSHDQLFDVTISLHSSL